MLILLHPMSLVLRCSLGYEGLLGYWTKEGWDTALLATRDFLVTQMGGLTLLSGYMPSRDTPIVRVVQDLDAPFSTFSCERR